MNRGTVGEASDLIFIGARITLYQMEKITLVGVFIAFGER